VNLAHLPEVEELLVCPRCGAPLATCDLGFRCSAASCVLSAPGSFPRVAGQPVLVDFEGSILRKEDLATLDAPLVSPSRSVDRLPRLVRSWWKPRNNVAARNIDLLLAQLGAPAFVLVVGGGSMGNGVERLYSTPRVAVLGFDVYTSPLTHFVADAHRIPLADGSVDAVVIQAVLEHLLDPDRAVAEIRRVLRADGLVYAETPFLQQVHAGAYDFRRFTSSGHRYLFRGFEEIAAGPVAGPGTQLLWSIDHLLRGLLRSQLAGKLARGAFSPLRVLDRVVSDAYAMDNASAYYFLGRRAERELTPREIVDYYRGAQRPPTKVRRSVE
jgi:SAM-dependent methyltransferase